MTNSNKRTRFVLVVLVVVLLLQVIRAGWSKYGEVQAKADLYDRIVKATKTGDNEYGYYGEFMWYALEELDAEESSPERHAQILGAIFWPENREALERAIRRTLDPAVR